jgi:hypothetical protein
VEDGKVEKSKEAAKGKKVEGPKAEDGKTDIKSSAKRLKSPIKPDEKPPKKPKAEAPAPVPAPAPLPEVPVDLQPEEPAEIPCISLVSKPLKHSKDEIHTLLSCIPIVTHSKSEENYIPSIGLQISLHSLSALPSSKFYLLSNSPPAEFLWVFSVLFQFTGVKIHYEDEKIWEEVKKLITGGKGTRIVHDLGTVLGQISDSFDFSNENLDKVEEIVAGIELDSKKFAEKCEVSGILLNFIKEAALFGGVLVPEGPSWRVKSRLEHKLAAFI